jgi:hypothetical protein
MKKLLSSIFLLPLVITSSLVYGQDTPLAQKIVEHHLAASGEANIDEVISDYAENAILISDGTVIKGKQAIRQTFEQLLLGPNPGQAEDAAAPSPLKVIRSAYEENLGFIVWSMGDGTIGSDTFVIEDGLITIQTVVLVPDI